ncbi:MAG: hypothetical protein ACI33S_01065 [Bacilli bacterium]
MNDRLNAFKIKFYEYCVTYYNMCLSTKDSTYLQYYKELLRIYNEINESIVTYSQLKKYISDLEKKRNMNLITSFDIVNDVIKIFDSININHQQCIIIKNLIFDLANNYYRICIKSKNKKDINNYKFIKSIYNHIKELNDEEFIEYFKYLKEKKFYNIDEKNIILEILKIYDSVLNNNIKENNKINHTSKNSNIYNKNLADKITILSKTNVKSRLSEYLNNRTKVLSSFKYSMNYASYYVCYIIDHYTVKSMLEGNTLDEIQKTYLKEINRQMLKDPYLFFSLPLSNLSKEKLLLFKRYMPDIDIILSNCKKLLNEAKTINEKISLSFHVSDNELDKLFKFLTYYISYNRIKDEFNYEILINYLFKKNYLNYYEISFLIKYFGYKKCVEENLTDVDINVACCDEKKGQSVLGSYIGGLVIVNKDHAIGTTFVNNTLNNSSTPLLIKNKKVIYEGSTILGTLYHELTHALQERDYINHSNTFREYIWSIKNIAVESDPKYFTRNYRFSECEADADQNMFLEFKKVAETYLKSQNLSTRAESHRKKFENRLLFSPKADSYGFKQITGKYEKEIADNFFRKNPKELEKYPIFKQFYDNRGIPFSLVTMLSNTLFNDEGYYYNQLVGKIYQKENISKEDFLSKNMNQRLTIIKNINTILRYINKRLKKASRLLESKENELISFQTQGVDETILINNNILIDLKIGNILINWHNNMLKVDPSINDKISSIDSSINIDFNYETNIFRIYEERIKKLIGEDIEKGIKL